MDFIEKLDFLMDKYNLNKRTLSQKSGIPYTTIDNWYKRGYEGLKLTTLKKLNNYFNTKLDFWILDEVTDPNYGKSSGFKVEFDEMEHIKKYRELDPYGQETVNMIMDRELNRTKQLAEFANRSPSASLRIYTYMHKIAAAGNGYYFDDIPTDTIEAPYKEGADFIIGVSGDSMEPTYNDGDLVYVEKSQIINTGDIGIFMLDNECYIKEAAERGLISHNSKYDLIPGNDNIHCIGKVLGKVELD